MGQLLHKRIGFVMPPHPSDPEQKERWYIPVFQWRDDKDITAMVLQWAQTEDVETREGTLVAESKQYFDPS